MSQVTVYDGFEKFAGKLPAALQNAGFSDELGAGIEGSFGVISVRGKVWRTKYRGEEVDLVDEEGNARPSLTVVILKAAPTKSKLYYADGYVEGTNNAPDCWSNNSVVPDASVPNKQSSTCALCPHNVFGSRITQQGKASKACADNKRIAIIPAEDMENEALGGPMLLRIPAASLVDAAQYGSKLAQMGFPVHGVVTRLKFDIKEAYPKLVFSPVRPVTEAEAARIIEYRDGPQIARIMAEASEFEGTTKEVEAPLQFEQSSQAAPKTTFRAAPQATQKPVQAAQPVQATGVAPTPAAAPARPAPAPQPTQAAKTEALINQYKDGDGEVDEATGVDALDDALDKLL